jgi:hypothetical protein
MYSISSYPIYFCPLIYKEGLTLKGLKWFPEQLFFSQATYNPSGVGVKTFKSLSGDTQKQENLLPFSYFSSLILMEKLLMWESIWMDQGAIISIEDHALFDVFELSLSPPIFQSGITASPS